MFKFRRMLVLLGRIASALEIIALHYAKEDGRMWSPGSSPKKFFDKDEAELLTTENVNMLVQELKDAERFKYGDHEAEN